MAASAATYDWNKTSGSGLRWDQAVNWDDGTGSTVPVAGDTANINLALEGNLGVSLNGNPLVGILNIGDSGEGLYTITLGTPTVDSLENPFAITGGAFGFKQSGNDLYLTYQVIPEPGSALLLLGGGLAMAARLRRTTRGI